MTLSQASIFTRKAIVIFFGVLILALIIKILFNIGYSIYQNCCVPAKVIKPDYKFGNIIGPNFPPSSASSGSFSYSIDTVTGDVPKNLPKVMKVYFIEPSTVTLLSADRAKKLANLLGFPNGPSKTSDTGQQFSDENGGNLNIDMSTFNFNYQRIPQSDNPNVLPNSTNAVTLFKTYLGTKGLLLPDIDSGRTNVTYDGPSISESNSVNVSIWPQDIEKYKIVTPDFNNGLIKTTIGKSSSDLNKFLKLDYYHFVLDPKTYALYPIKDSGQALADLKSGSSYLSIKPNSNQVSITSIDLEYYQSTDQGSYMFPVYVFQGPQFSAYVQAVISTPTPTGTN